MNSSITKVGHNIGFELKMLKHVYDVNVCDPIEDTMLMHYSINENRGTHGLKKLVWTYLPDMGGYEAEVESAAKKVNNDYSQIPLYILHPYNCRDTDVTLRLYNLFKANPDFISQEKIYRGVSLPLVRVLEKMERFGVGIDVERLKEDLDKLPDLQREAMHIILCDENVRKAEAIINKGLPKGKPRIQFNVRSGPHLRTLMFKVMKLKPLRRTKKNQTSTDKNTLTFFGEEHPTIKKILEHKALMDLQSKYLKPLYDEATGYDGSVRTNYNIHGTVTGRLSSSDPNLQNISPKVQSYFIARQRILEVER
jgi:DNA polymerase-1